MKNILKSIKQFLCPIIGTWYLFGGWEYGHRWSRLDGENRIFCKDCLKQVYCYTYKPDGMDSKRYKEYKEILDEEVGV